MAIDAYPPYSKPFVNSLRKYSSMFYTTPSRNMPAKAMMIIVNSAIARCGE
jgi:hypothetical protein